MPVESGRPKFLLIDEGDLILGQCLDAEGLFVESRDDDEPATVELLGCLLVQRMRDYLSGSKRYRQRNPLGLGGLRMLDAAEEPLVDFWLSQIIDWRPSAFSGLFHTASIHQSGGALIALGGARRRLSRGFSGVRR